jgi:PPOX class probable F420-dependent enzyme
MRPLSAPERSLLAEARRATLATIRPDGTARLVPIGFAAMAGVDGAMELWSSLDEKPKRSRDPRGLARVRDVLRRPDVAVLVDRWSETWAELAWLRLGGMARLVEPTDVPVAVAPALRARYPQYRDHDLEGRPMLAITITSIASWGLSSAPAGEVAQVDPAVVAVRVEAVATEEADEGHPEPLGRLDGEVGRG